jgi:phage-related protein
MKFKQYLNEAGKAITDINEFNDLVHKKCKPYLNLIKPLQHPFIKGMLPEYDTGIKKVRQHRSPSGTDRIVFKRLNDWLQKNGHNRRDNSLITSYMPPDD